MFTQPGLSDHNSHTAAAAAAASPKLFPASIPLQRAPSLPYIHILCQVSAAAAAAAAAAASLMLEALLAP
jgi:hypothetical protein